MNQWELEANTRNRRQARENVCDQVAIGFGFASDWLRGGASFLNQSQSVVKQKQSNSAITFDSQLKKPLYYSTIQRELTRDIF